MKYKLIAKDEVYEAWQYDGKIQDEFLDNSNWILDAIADGAFIIHQNKLFAPVNEEKSQYGMIPEGFWILKHEAEEWNGKHNWIMMDSKTFKKECELIKE
jgi:hypothetical protein